MTQSASIVMFSCLAISRQGHLPSKTPKTDGPFGMGWKVMVCESLLSTVAVCAFEKFTNTQKAVVNTIEICLMNFLIYKKLFCLFYYHLTGKRSHSDLLLSL